MKHPLFKETNTLQINVDKLLEVAQGLRVSNPKIASELLSIIIEIRGIPLAVTELFNTNIEKQNNELDNMIRRLKGGLL